MYDGDAAIGRQRRAQSGKLILATAQTRNRV
jgi:hypothetical protein